MSSPQNIASVNSEIMDSIARSTEMDWIETEAGEAYSKVLWTGPESGRWAVLLEWMKGYVAPPHKHLSAAQVLILEGKLHVRDGVLEAGDYIYEPNGMVHGATAALEDTECLFISDGSALFYSTMRPSLANVDGSSFRSSAIRRQPTVNLSSRAVATALEQQFHQLGSRRQAGRKRCPNSLGFVRHL